MQPLKVNYASVRVVGISGPEADAQGIVGSYSPGMHKVEIKADLPPAEQARVLVHELIHSCFDVYELKDRKLTEEDVCEILDGPLTALLTDNPMLIGVLHQAVNHGQPIVQFVSE
jgi:hypothetical protein